MCGCLIQRSHFLSYLYQDFVIVKTRVDKPIRAVMKNRISSFNVLASALRQFANMYTFVRDSQSYIDGLNDDGL